MKNSTVRFNKPNHPWLKALNKNKGKSDEEFYVLEEEFRRFKERKQQQLKEEPRVFSDYIPKEPKKIRIQTAGAKLKHVGKNRQSID